MGSQLKKGFLDMSVLAILKRNDSYGYSLIQEMKALIEVPESTLYPILKRLVNKKYLKSYSKEHNGRLRKYYQITALGIEHLDASIKEWQQLKIIIDTMSEKKGD
ncbi:PadR family transcriptional regulator [endosymbiont 'TC1' of Trimyema compressum]|uniref:PadR family transcriptional regulator n=1 Tax=endosymbiont 'TC1' of Trimyema compressum TaxID=243899 RepID=UPI0007F0FB3F|nr:PadR family transcriptional regulator [endosymbiont 'TC1' of Trimyema compressum]AMP21436.1 PadR family transcriptional regulator [endosymbiont 'TC1' of Trimyema compressum]